jgi:hypothetical protein
MTSDIIGRFNNLEHTFIVEQGHSTTNNPDTFRMVLRHFYSTTGTASQITTSESMGYGMLLLAYLAGAPGDGGAVSGGLNLRTIGNRRLTVQDYFDGMHRTHAAFPTNGGTSFHLDGGTNRRWLIAWQITANWEGQTVTQVRNSGRTSNWNLNYSGPSSAADGDLDMAYAYILAHQLWGSSGRVNYLQWARHMIDAIWRDVTDPSNRHLRLGNWASSANSTRITRPSDFILYALRAFNGSVRNDANQLVALSNRDWNAVYNATLDAIGQGTDPSMRAGVPSATNSGTPNTTTRTGFLPGFQYRDTTGTTFSANGVTNSFNGKWMPSLGNWFNEGGGTSDRTIDFNACRVPWRLSTEIMLYGDTTVRYRTSATNWNTSFTIGTASVRPWFQLATVNASSISSPSRRFMDGSGGSSSTGIDYAAPMALATSLYGNQTQVNNAWNVMRNNSVGSNEFGAYYNIICMVTASGNLWDPLMVNPVTQAPSITTQPANRTVNAGETATFTVAASGNPSPTFQWQFSTNSGSSWGNVTTSSHPGATGITSTTLTIPNAAIAMSTQRFRVTATNTAGSATSNGNATLTVQNNTVAPSITTQPANRAVTAGQSATFTAAASGTPNPTFQWQARPNSSGTWANVTTGNYPGATGMTTVTLTIPNTTTSMNGHQFRMNATNTHNTSTTANSNAATLSVTAPATNAFGFVYMFTEPVGSTWPFGFNNADSPKVEFNATNNGDHVLTLPAWQGGDGSLHASHRDVYLMQPAATSNTHITLRSITINNGANQLTTAMNHTEAPARWLVASTIGPVTTVGENANGTNNAAAFAAAGYVLRTFQIPASIQIPAGAVVRVTYRVGTGTALTGTPVITGTAQVGQTLTAGNGNLNVTTGLSYNWQRRNAGNTDWENAGGTRTNSTYVPVVGDVGRTLRVQVTSSNAGGTANSAATSPVAAEAVQTYSVTVTSTGATGAGRTPTGNQAAGTNITLNPGTRYGWTFQSWSITPSVSFTNSTTANTPAARFNMPAANVTAVANWTQDTVVVGVPPANRGIGFVYMYSTPNSGAQDWAAGFNQINGPYVDFDITVPGTHTLTLPAWPRSDTAFDNGNTRVHLLSPQNAPAGALPVTATISVGGTARLSNLPLTANGGFWNEVGTGNTGTYFGTGANGITLGQGSIAWNSEDLTQNGVRMVDRMNSLTGTSLSDMGGINQGQIITITYTVGAVAKLPGPAAPAAPTRASSSQTYITLNTIAGAEYSRDGGAWQSSPIFAGLTAGTSYSFRARIAETSTHLPSNPSAAASISTDSAGQASAGYVWAAGSTADWGLAINLLSETTVSNVATNNGPVSHNALLRDGWTGYAATHSFADPSEENRIRVFFLAPKTLSPKRIARLTTIQNGSTTVQVNQNLVPAYSYWIPAGATHVSTGLSGDGGDANGRSTLEAEFDALGFELFEYVLTDQQHAAIGNATVNGNLVFNFTFTNGTTITNPTVNWPASFTATYGQTLSQITLPNNGSGTPGTFSWTSGGIPVGNAGARQHELRFTPTDTAAFNTVTQNVTVNVAALRLTWSANSTVSNRVYNRTTTATVATAPALVGVIAGDTVNITVGTVNFNDANAGNGKAVTATGYGISGNDNYLAPTAQPGFNTANITPLQLTWSGGNTVNNKVFDGNVTATVATAPTLVGIISGDTVNIVVGTVSFNNAAVGNNKPVTATGYGISGNSNYTAPSAQPVFAAANITEAYDPGVPAANRGIGFVYLYGADSAGNATTTGQLWDNGFTHIDGPFVNFDLTVDATHTLTLPPMPHSATTWVTGNARVHMLRPVTAPANMKDVTVTISVNGQPRVTSGNINTGGHAGWWNNAVGTYFGNVHLDTAGTITEPMLTAARTGAGVNMTGRQFNANAGQITSLGAINAGDIVTITYTVGNPELPATLYGDVNGDGVINSGDVTMLKYYIADSDRPTFGTRNPTFRIANARVRDGVSEPNAADVSLLQLWIATPVPDRHTVILGPR